LNFKRIGIAFLTTALLGQSQTDTAAKPSFEVATIKPSSPDARGVRFGLIDGGRWRVYNHTLKECVAYAYTLTVGLVSGGPPWIASDRYDIVALEPGGSRPTAGQNLLMFQNLLADRFKLKIHRETKQLPVYNLVLGKNGAKVVESAPGARKDDLVYQGSPGGVGLPGHSVTMGDLVAFIGRVFLDRLVIDKTGLTGSYDFDLKFAAEGTLLAPPGPPPSGVDANELPDFFAAIQQQLGLKLEPAKGPVETIVIDSVERPSEN
jgi:uncharacterized protein (TIGR03435 family)